MITKLTIKLMDHLNEDGSLYFVLYRHYIRKFRKVHGITVLDKFS